MKQNWRRKFFWALWRLSQSQSCTEQHSMGTETKMTDIKTRKKNRRRSQKIRRAKSKRKIREKAKRRSNGRFASGSNKMMDREKVRRPTPPSLGFSFPLQYVFGPPGFAAIPAGETFAGCQGAPICFLLSIQALLALPQTTHGYRRFFVTSIVSRFVLRLQRQYIPWIPLPISDCRRIAPNRMIRAYIPSNTADQDSRIVRLAHANGIRCPVHWKR